MPRVKCAVCGESFDYAKVQAVRHGARRYAHYTCDPQGELVPLPAQKVKEKTDEEKILDYCKEIFGDDTNYAMIKRQIKQYTAQGFTETGILKALHYWYEIKKQSTAKANGAIGIVGFIYNQARDYYFDIWQANQNNSKFTLNEYTPEEKKITIKSPRSKPFNIRKLFSFLDNDREENK